MLSVPAGTARLRVNAQNFQDAIIWARASNNNVRKIVVEAHQTGRIPAGTMQRTNEDGFLARLVIYTSG